MTALPPPYLTEVADRVHVYVQPDGGWCLSNAGVLVAPAGPVLIDTAATEPRARALRDAVATLTDLAPRVVVNTHHHGDHTFGNGVFRDSVIVGHEECRTNMLESGLTITGLWKHVDWGHLEVVPPELTFADRMSLHAGDLRVELIHVGPAHTRDDVVAWLPDRRVLFAGDVVFSGGTPFVLMGSVSGSLAALERLRALDAEVIVSGHGAVAGPELLDATEAYLRFLRGRARDGIAAGLTPLEAALETDLDQEGGGAFGGLLNPERLVGNLHRAYAEERGEAPGVPLDDATAILEMVTYNGGEIPACHA